LDACRMRILLPRTCTYHYVSTEICLGLIMTLLSQFDDGTYGSFIMARGDTVSTMGNPFLRGVYSIFDQKNWTIFLGQVRHTDEEDIVEISKGGFRAKG
jgi:hypothetical protein